MGYDPQLDKVVFSQTNNKTITNTTTETSALGAGIGTSMIPANSLIPGKRIRIHGEGIYTIPALLASSITIKVKIGGVTVGSVTTSSLATGATNLAFSFDTLIVCRAIGTSGKVVVGGSAQYSTVGGSKAFDDLDNSGAESTVNTTIDNQIDVTLTWGQASTTRSITTTIATIMAV